MHAGAGRGRRRRVVGEAGEHEHADRGTARAACSIGVNSKPAPSGRRRPLLHHHAVRHVDDAEARAAPVAGVCAVAVSAGTMLSSSGSASVAPRPRSTVRRGSAFLVMIMTPILRI